METAPSLRQNLTPMLRQYFDLKDSCPDTVLFFRMGDFYEIFGDDAVEVSGVLNIVLTKRDKGNDGSIPFCGVPHHSARTYWLKLLKLNYKVAIADQVEDPSQAKGLVRRELTKFLTPACIDDLEGLQSDKPNYLMFIHEDPESKKWITGLADVSTGELRIGESEYPDTVCKILETYKPKELLLRRFLTPIFKEKLSNYLAQETLLFTPMPEAILRDETGQKELVQTVLGNSIDLPVATKESAIAALASLFTHLRELKFSLGQFLNVSPLNESERATLNSSAVNDLEIFTTARQNQQKGSLFYEVNHCLTPMGSRLLRWSLAHPLLNTRMVQRSHNWVSYFLSLGEKSLEDLRNRLNGIADIERLLVKVISKNIKPKELSSIRDGLSKVFKLYELFSVGGPSTEFTPSVVEGLGMTGPALGMTGISHDSSDSEFPEILKELSLSEPALHSLASALRAEVGNLGNGDEIFLANFDSLLDEKNELSKNGEDKVQEYQESLKKKTGISSLKIKHHKNFGLLIEITKTHLSKTPDEFIRRQTMVNCERFVTIDLQELSDALSSAKDDAIAREAALYDTFLDQLNQQIAALKKVSNALAKFDMHLSFAWLSLQKKYCRPEIVNDAIELKSVRHPTVESFIGAHAFNPNDIFLNEKAKQILITGPNMGGKSTIMRTVAICAILNQSGCFVPALSAKIPIFDQIFTRVGASDDLVKGLSTFMVEMTETALILRQAGPRSLVILDEVGRGTSTEDGLAIASAVLENLATKVRSWTFFATHYHELVQFSKSFSIVKTYQTEVIKRNDSIRFTHRLIEGASGSSYGIQVAKLAGIPDSVTSRAHEFLRHAGAEISKVSEIPLPKEKLSTKYQRLSAIIEGVSINQTTPLQALNILTQLKDELDAGPKKALFHQQSSLD